MFEVEKTGPRSESGREVELGDRALEGQASEHCRFLSCGRLPLMLALRPQPMKALYRIAHVDGGLPECCHSCVCWCRWWHRGAGCRALTGKPHYSAPHARVRVHACVCPDRQAERQAVCPLWAFDTLMSVAVLARAPEQSSIPASVLRSSTCIVPLRVQEIASSTLHSGSQLTLTLEATIVYYLIGISLSRLSIDPACRHFEVSTC